MTSKHHTPDSEPELSAQEQTFYSRQLILPEFGSAGQLCLKNSRIVVVGAGGLGAPALLYLAGAGVGEIVIVDDDAVEPSNLHRQVIHTYARVGNSKAESAAAAARALNPFITVTAVRERLTRDNALDLLQGADAVLDGSDNFATRSTVSAAAQRLGIAHIWAAILGFDAQLSVFWCGRGPVYEDLYPQEPEPGSVPSCSTAGVMGALAGVIGSAMAMEAIKCLTGVGEPLIGRVGVYSALTGTWEYIPLAASNQGKPRKFEEHHEKPTQEPAQDVTFLHLAVKMPNLQPAQTVKNLTPAEVRQMAQSEKISLVDVREEIEFSSFALEGAVNFPLTQIFQAAREGSLTADLREKIIDPEATCAVLYCTGTSRAVAAARELRAVASVPVYVLTGGISGWFVSEKP